MGSFCAIKESVFLGGCFLCADILQYRRNSSPPLDSTQVGKFVYTIAKFGIRPLVDLGTFRHDTFRADMLTSRRRRHVLQLVPLELILGLWRAAWIASCCCAMLLQPTSNLFKASLLTSAVLLMRVFE